MKLIIYKGFDESFYSSLKEDALVESDISKKINVLEFDKKIRKQLDISLLSLEEDDERWCTYEEYTLIKTRVDEAIKEDGLRLVIFKNNMYPDYYPIPFKVDEDLYFEIQNIFEGNNKVESSEECKRFTAVYNSLISIDGVYFGSFYNYEYENEDSILINNYYPANIEISDDKCSTDYNVFLNEDVDTYLRNLSNIKSIAPGVIGFKSTDGPVSKRIQLSLQAYCLNNNIKIVHFNEPLPEEKERENELIEIARNDIGIKGFSGFRNIKFYKNPDIDKEVTEISQGQIIQEIIKQAENSYNEESGHSFRDVFITASTGAGKSVMFQIPAVYLAKKYNKLTIIIEPVKALMQDQKEKLNKSGYFRVEAFNSDLISQVEKEAVIKKVKDGEIDLLYLSPETLLSYSIETIIGDREIGLLIVDEAHIVTTWGVGFRPDYWYLGGYINRLRNQIQTKSGMKRKVYHFPVCAFTATAVNGGIDDSISDTIISLYMENPVKYIGYVKRDDITFEIVKKRRGEKLSKTEYEQEKRDALNERIHEWLDKNEKTIVYFPYASLANDASKGFKGFAGITEDKRIGTYTGRNINEMSTEVFNDTKRQVFESFRNGTKPVVYATKAFGMGVDVDDVKNVYHYAVSGNLNDYVQEIGRAARRSDLHGYAITDNYYNDISYMKTLFGMSQIRQYQIKEVLEGIYDTYRNKKGARSFLISPESFTYIFNGKGMKDEDKCINKLKTCLLMLEKDFYDKFNFKVLISRPQSVFTKAFVCIKKEEEKEALESRYGSSFKFVERGRYNEKQSDGSILSDVGDIYSIDLKEVWEDYYPNISFPQFKYWYFNSDSNSKDKVNIMPEIRKSIYPRQKVTIETRKDKLLSEIRQDILEDFEYIANTLYSTFGRNFFTTDDFLRILRERFDNTTSRIIANSLFELVDPESRCVKKRANDTSGKTYYSLSNGNFKEFMRRNIIKSKIVSNITKIEGATSYSSYLSLTTDEKSMIALKLLSIFDYITYEVAGGEEPEIFIRLNDPEKVKNIVFGNMQYYNGYIRRAKQKHDRDVEILLKFFNDLNTDKERWDYIEDYFLGYDVLNVSKSEEVEQVSLLKSVDKEHSYQTNMFRNWEEIKLFFDDSDIAYINKLSEEIQTIPEYLETSVKKSDIGNDIIMSWPSKNIVICQQDTSDNALELFKAKGWIAFRINEIDMAALKEELN